MNIESVQYIYADGNITSIKAIIDGNECFVPMINGNRHYIEIMRLVEAGELTIQEEVTS